MAGPAFSAAALPVSTKMPAPMMAPIPSATRLVAVSVRLSGTPSWATISWTSGSFARESRLSIDCLAKSPRIAPPHVGCFAPAA